MKVFSCKGVSLIEAIIYIGLLAIMLPVVTVSLIRTTQEINLFDRRTHIAATAATLLSQLSLEITQAKAISLSQSSLGDNPSTLVFTDASGQTVKIDRQTTSLPLTGGDQIMHRLRVQQGVSPAYYITDADIDVVSWIVKRILNENGLLTALRIHLELASFSQTTDSQNANFVSDTTIVLQPQTTTN